MRSMEGEWRGKTRSTPTPPETLRTVKVSRMPPPLRAITTPWKTWMRSLLPSTTLTCTRTVSPARNSGTPSLRNGASIAVNASMGIAPCLAQLSSGEDCILSVPVLPLASLELFALLGRQHRPGQQIRPLFGGGPQGLALPPALYRRVVARQQHRGYGEPLDHCRPGVLRVVEQAAAEAVALHRARQLHHPR